MQHIANPSDMSLRSAVETAIAEVLGDLSTHVGVAVDAGTVTLTGTVLSSDAHLATVDAVEVVEGVHALADDLEISARPACGINDTTIAAAAQRALQHCDSIPTDSVTAEVRHGVVSLTGRVSSTTERLAAERAVIYLPGLVQIDNRIQVGTSDDVQTDSVS